MQILPLPARLARADIGQVWSGTHGAHQVRPVENVIARHRTSRSPVPLNICSKVGRPYLLAVAVKAAFGNIYFSPEQYRTRGRNRMGDTILIDNRFQLLKLPVRNQHQPG